MDVEPCCSSGASVVLNVLLKSHGGELYHQVNDILCKGIFKLAHMWTIISCSSLEMKTISYNF